MQTHTGCFFSRHPDPEDVWVRWALLGLEKRRLNLWRLQEEQPLLRTVCTRVGAGDLDEFLDN